MTLPRSEDLGQSGGLPRSEALGQSETDQPLTELCERGWKLLYQHGSRRRDHESNDLISFQLDDWYLHSVNRLMWIQRVVNPTLRTYKSVFSVDEEGVVGALDVIECAYALERFRQYSILDDLAEIQVEKT